MQEITLSNNLAQIELEISHHKQIAGQSIWEIGRRLNHVKEHDLAHGEFIQWLKKINIERTEAHRMMKVAEQLPDVATLQHLGTTALHLIATLPDDQKREQLDRIEQGDSPTVRELQETKRQLKLAEADKERLKQQNERLAEQALSAKVVEKEVIKEIVPDDYESTKQLNQTLLDKNKELSKTLEEAEWELDSKKLELSTIKLESQRAIEVTNQIRHLEGKKEKLENLVTSISELSSIISDVQNFFDTKMAPLRFKPIINNVNAYYSVAEVTKMVNTVQSWCDEMYKIIPSGNRKTVEEVIINE
ncbi:DUF3102 domain-containing protein [Streptococcus agalactiae]|uniref:DUF3102 domain-containing protein n=1 Tax=Streptococcus agalactiae TaxID=1311 RepID=UPI003DA14676